jgi:HEAT repeat protein
MEQRTEDTREQHDLQPLVEQLGSPDFAGAQAAAAALVAGLAHPNWRVRKQCAGLMDHLADARCVAPLQRALTDPRVGVRRLALHALGCQPCKTAPLPADVVGLLVERALADPSRPVRRVAVHLLGLQPYDPRAVAALQQILAQATDPKLLSRARHALHAHQQPAAARCPARWKTSP